MKTYKFSLYILAKNLVYAIGGALVAMLVLHWFFSDFITLAAGALVGIALLYFTLYGDNINLALDDKALTVKRFNTVLHQFALAEYSFHANITTSSDGLTSDSDCTLVATDGSGEETSVDCSILGPRKFYRLLDDLGVLDPDPVKLETRQSN